MARCHFRETIDDGAGNVVQGALCRIYEAGTTTPITDMWSAASGGVNVATLTSDATGQIEAWFDNEKSVDVLVTDNGHSAHYPASSTSLSWANYSRTYDLREPPPVINPDTCPTAAAINAALAAYAGRRCTIRGTWNNLTGAGTGSPPALLDFPVAIKPFFDDVVFGLDASCDMAAGRIHSTAKPRGDCTVIGTSKAGNQEGFIFGQDGSGCTKVRGRQFNLTVTNCRRPGRFYADGFVGKEVANVRLGTVDLSGCAEGWSWLTTGPESTIAVASGGQTLPQATIHVDDLSDWMAPNVRGHPAWNTAIVLTSLGYQSVTFTGISGNDLTGCSGGSGVIATAARIKQHPQHWCNVNSIHELIANTVDGPAYIVDCADHMSIDEGDIEHCCQDGVSWAGDLIAGLRPSMGKLWNEANRPGGGPDRNLRVADYPLVVSPEIDPQSMALNTMSFNYSGQRSLKVRRGDGSHSNYGAEGVARLLVGPNGTAIDDTNTAPRLETTGIEGKRKSVADPRFPIEIGLPGVGVYIENNVDVARKRIFDLDGNGNLAVTGIITAAGGAGVDINLDLPTGYIAETHPRDRRFESTVTLLSGRETVSRIVVPPNEPVTAITLWAGTTGMSVDGTHQSVLFRDAAGNLLGYTADDGPTAWAPNTSKKFYLSRRITNAAINAASNQLSGTGLTQADVGRQVTVVGAGAAGVPLGTSAARVTITSVDPNTGIATLSANAATSVAGAVAYIGTPWQAPDAEARYYIGPVVVATTPPTLYGTTQINIGVYQDAPAMCGLAPTTGLTTPDTAPASMGVLAAAQFAYGRIS